MAVDNDGLHEDPLDPRPSEAADAALELFKQLIALASGLIAVGAAFAEKLLTAEWIDFLLATSWSLLAISILAALHSMAAIVKSRLRPEFSWERGIGQRMAWVSRFTFVAGVVCFGAFAFVAGRYHAKAATSNVGLRATVLLHTTSVHGSSTFVIDSSTIIMPGRKR
jgi:hypothetical protein